MWYQQQSDDYRPLFWVSGRPVYANTLLVAAHVISFVVCAICVSFASLEAVSYALTLLPVNVWHGEVWRLVSYVAFSPAFLTQGPFIFLWSMLILYFCGREVEQFVGRKSYLGLYAALVLIPALLLWLVGPFLGLASLGYLGCSEVIFGVFVAFATIYPGAMPSMWVTIPVWILAWIFFGIYMLIYLAFHEFTAMFMLMISSGVGYLTMRWMGAGRGLSWLTDWMETRRAERLARKHQIKVITEKKSAESIDAILDKISKQGVNSLTSSERAALERVRTKLIDRDRR
jgi:membrane associated rhomboid family serine protease